MIREELETFAEWIAKNHGEVVLTEHQRSLVDALDSTKHLFFSGRAHGRALMQHWYEEFLTPIPEKE